MTSRSALVDLDAPEPAASKEDRLRPWLWIAVGALLISGVVSAFVVDDEKSPAQRVAAAGAQAQAEDHAFEVTMEAADASPFPSGFTFNGVVDVETSRSKAEGKAAGLVLEVVTEGQVQYLKLPAALGATGKPWIRFDASGLAGPQPAPGTNPLDALRQLDAVVGEVERVGEDKVRGEDTVRLRFTVDAIRANPKAAEQLPEELAARLREVPMELWLDDRDRPRRIRQVIDLGPNAGGKVTTTVELFDFGKAVSVELPPADQVQDVDLSDPAAVGALFGGATPPS